MILRLGLIVAFAGMIGAFALTVQDIYRLAERACGGAEAGGNCRSFAEYFARSDIMIFSTFAVAIAILVLLTNFRSRAR